MPGPKAGEIGPGPGTGAEPPGEAPPYSRGKSALARSVTDWMDSGYLTRDDHDTRHQPSCLVTSTPRWQGFLKGEKGESEAGAYQSDIGKQAHIQYRGPGRRTRERRRGFGGEAGVR
jgi:hypothetical protein